jgi:hypothetical protein
LTLALGMTTPGRWSLRVGAERHLPIQIESDFGTFRVDRSGLTLGAGHYWELGDFQLEVGGGGAADLLMRRDATSVLELSTHKDASYARFGGFLASRVRYALYGPLSVEVRVGAAYFPRPIRFVTAPERVELTSLWRLVPSADLGLELSAP